MVVRTVSKAGSVGNMEMGLSDLGHVTEILSGPFLSVSEEPNLFFNIPSGSDILRS